MSIILYHLHVDVIRSSAINLHLFLRHNIVCVCNFRLKKLRKLSCSARRFCKTCCRLLLPEDDDHDEHSIVNSVSNSQLRSPTYLLPSLSDNKTNAVSWFVSECQSSVRLEFGLNLVNGCEAGWLSRKDINSHT